MSKLKTMILAPLAAVAAVAGVVEGIIICNKIARVKLADAALREIDDHTELFEEDDSSEPEEETPDSKESDAEAADKELKSASEDDASCPAADNKENAWMDDEQEADSAAEIDALDFGTENEE